jgi:ATP-dependent DNA helicase RecQ
MFWHGMLQQRCGYLKTGSYCVRGERCMADRVRTGDDLLADPDAEQELSSEIPLDLTGIAFDELSLDLCLAAARALFRRGQMDDARRALDSACLVAYDSITFADQCAEAALELGQPERAREILQARLAKSDAIMGYRLFAQVLLNLGQQAAANELARQLRQTHSGQLTAWGVIGDVALADGDLEGARAAYREILRRSPSSTSGLLGMARYYAMIGDKEGVHREIASVFAAYGDHPSRWVLRATREIAERLSDADWLADLDVRLAELDRKDDQRLAERLELARQGQTRRQDMPQRIVGRTTPIRLSRPDKESAEAPEPEELSTEAPPELVEALRDHFGYESFRPGQAQVIQAALRGEDTLALMPTGAGKSLCYQLPAMLLPGATVLISPLIALMKDQVDNLPEAIRARTAFINSELDTAEQERRLALLAEGKLKLVYVAPERLRQPPFIHALRRARVSLFVIDEAHCISQWGHDFRPDYLFIPKALHAMAAERPGEAASAPPILALTATATPAMRREISAALGRTLRVISTGVFRPNLRYEVEYLHSQEDKMRALVARCAETGGSGIVYARSRESCEKLASLLRQEDINAAHYHAGMNHQERTQVQDAWASGKTRIVVATVAFGLGIDKADVRFIIHYNLPNSLEAYCQESGRAGRDGRPSRCILFYSSSDKSHLTQWLREEALDLPFLRLIYGEIKRQIGGGALGLISPEQLEQRINTLMQHGEREASETMVRVGISVLERAELLRRHFDAPRSAFVSWAGTNGHSLPPDCGSFIAAARLGPGHPQNLDLTALAQRLQWTPADLEERLLTWRDAGLIDYRGGPRQMLIELLPAPPDAAQRLQELLDTLQEQHEAQIERLASYARSAACRHKTIAQHFAARLSRPCGVCDRCAPAPPASRTRKADHLTLRRRSGMDHTEQAAIEETILLCLRSVPFGLGKTGLARTLTGSIAAPPSGRRSAYYGRLAAFSTSRIEKAIQGMLDAGYLQRDESGEYQVLVITEQAQMPGERRVGGS